MKSINLKTAWPHLASVLIIILCAFIYCSPVLKGKSMSQSDILKHKSQSKEILEYRESGEEILWTSRVFSGMSVFNISASFKTNVISVIKKTTTFFPNGVNIIIISCIGFYILMLMMGLNPWLALIAALAYGLSSNLLSSLNAGHNTKVLSIAYLAPSIGAVIMTFRGKIWVGSFLTSLFVGLMISASHFQIVYYFLLISVLGGAIFLAYAIKEKMLDSYFKSVVALLIAGLIGFLPNFSKIYNVREHSQETIRGGQKLLSSKSEKDEGGLDRSYAMSWSHGIMESFTVVVPSILGGSSAEELPDNGAVAELVGKQRKGQPLMGPTYIGDQPFLQGVIYFGAAFIFLFFLALFVVEGKYKVWLLAVIALSFFIAWGRHFSIFTDFLFDYLPMYNKFRAPSMALAMAGIAIPLLGMIGLSKVFAKELDTVKFSKAFKLTLYSTGGLMLILLLYGLTTDWMGPNDAALQAKQPWSNPELFAALLEDRKSLFLSDWMLSTFIMAICAGVIWLYSRAKLSMTMALIVLAVVTIGDSWRVSKRYLNDDSFVEQRKYDNHFATSGADKAILQDTDPHYRVLNLMGDPWTDGPTCAHHENIGGHHAAKVQRYQDMIENQLRTQIQIINKAVLQGPEGLTMNPQVSKSMTAYNMLNTKYYIVQKNAQGVVRNPTACGNAWFVSDIKQVSSHDDEMAAISTIDPLETAIIHNEFEADLYNYEFEKGANASVQLTAFKPDHLEYKSNNSSAGLAVFSEVYYTNGWNAYVDNEPVDIYRANYILRAIKIPAGEHNIEMRFEPASYAIGEGVSLAGSILFVLFGAGVAYARWKNWKGLEIQPELEEES